MFLPPTGRVTLPGPDPKKLPTTVDGLHQVLLRIEASDDKEADSDLRAAGAGDGVVHSGAVAGFPLPVLRYFVGSVPPGFVPGRLSLLAPAGGAVLSATEPLTFSWTPDRDAVLYRLEIADGEGKEVFSAVLQQGLSSYRAPSFLRPGGPGKLRWRVVATGPDGRVTASSPWRDVSWAGETPAE